MAPPARDLLRTFVALVPSDATTSGLAAEAERVARADRAAHAVARGSLHLTLVFLGATDVEALPCIVQALAEGLAGLPPVRLRPVGLSAFPSPKTPRVVFAELAPDTHHALEVLSVRVAEALAAVGHGPDRAERFHPHVTLARMGAVPSGGASSAGAGRTRVPGAGRPGPRHGVDPVGASTPALEKLLTAGTLQGTYTDDVITDVRLLSSEPATGPNAPPGRVYRVLASFPLGPTPSDPAPFPAKFPANPAGAKPSAPSVSSASAERP